MPIEVVFLAERDSGEPRLALFCDGVERSEDPPMVGTGTGDTPKRLRPDTAVLYGVDAVALGGLDWQPRWVSFPGEGGRDHVEAIATIELDVTRNVVTVHLRRGS